MKPDQILEKHIRDKESSVYDKLQNQYRTPWFVWTRDKIATYLLTKTNRILDAGCGTGSLLSHFCFDKQRTVIGVDFSFQSLLVAKYKRRPPILLCNSNLLSLPFSSGCFDGVSCLGVLQHIPCDLRSSVVRELARVSRSGATLIVQVYNAETAPRFGRVKGDGRFETGMYYHSFAYGELSELLEQVGWRIVKVSGFGTFRYFLSFVRGGTWFYKCFAFITFPIEFIITLWGGKRFSQYGEYLYSMFKFFAFINNQHTVTP
jgi:ubiquinone/menaquinone biosynthesis C-methylase UbiE